MKNVRAVLFDLDGTLLDTAGDLGSALNHLLLELGASALPQATIRPYAGAGVRGLLKLGLNLLPTDADYSSLSERLLAIYQQHLLETTQLFPGMADILSFLEKEKLPWGIVTNKPAKFTDPILHHLNLATRAGCVISGDSLSTRKPDPEPILHACKLLQRDPRECLYVGDSEIDIRASRDAGGVSLAALYGYIPPGENPREWEANGYIEHPRDILGWLGK